MKIIRLTSTNKKPINLVISQIASFQTSDNPIFNFATTIVTLKNGHSVVCTEDEQQIFARLPKFKIH